MRGLKRVKVFISAAQWAATAEANAAAHTELGKRLEDFPGVAGALPIHGRFNGTYEESYVAFLQPGDIPETISELVCLADEFEQTYVLVVWGDDAAELVNVDDELHGLDSDGILGTFTALPEGVEPGPYENYSTFDRTRYFVVR